MHDVCGVKCRVKGVGETLLRLILGEMEMPKEDGLPRFVKLKKVLAGK